MGTLAKNPEKTSKIVLKMKSVYTRMMVFLRVNFEHVLKMVVKMKFSCKKHPENEKC